VGVVEPPFEHEFTVHLELARRRGLMGVVRPHSTDRDQRVGAMFEGVSDEELEIAGRVATGAEAGAVVALDVDLLAPSTPKATCGPS
jgi:hypothetical protein